MQRLEFGFTIQGGKLVMNNKDAFIERVPRTFKEGTKGIMRLEEAEACKSNWQLRYYHGPVMDMALKYLTECGYDLNKVQARAMYEENNPHLVDAIQHNDGGVMNVRIGLSDCSKERMIRVIDWTIHELATECYVVESAEEWRNNLGIDK